MIFDNLPEEILYNIYTIALHKIHINLILYKIQNIKNTIDYKKKNKSELLIFCDLYKRLNYIKQNKKDIKIYSDIYYFNILFNISKKIMFSYFTFY